LFSPPGFAKHRFFLTSTVGQKARVTKEEPPATPEKPATVKPLSPARDKVAFTASEELRDKLERLQALIPGGDLASIIDAAVSEKLGRLEAKRYGKTKVAERDWGPPAAYSVTPRRAPAELARCDSGEKLRSGVGV
jgi:hypothetical protein